MDTITITGTVLLLHYIIMTRTGWVGADVGMQQQIINMAQKSYKSKNTHLGT